jgi:hypothetical protein
MPIHIGCSRPLNDINPDHNRFGTECFGTLSRAIGPLLGHNFCTASAQPESPSLIHFGFLSLILTNPPDFLHGALPCCFSRFRTAFCCSV